MTAPRTGLFTRKASPMQSSNAGSPGPGDNAGGPPADTGEEGEGMTVTCPQCGCAFDPDQQEGETSGTNPEQLAAMLGLSGGGGAPSGAMPMGGM